MGPFVVEMVRNRLASQLGVDTSTGEEAEEKAAPRMRATLLIVGRRSMVGREGETAGDVVRRRISTAWCSTATRQIYLYIRLFGGTQTSVANTNVAFCLDLILAQLHVACICEPHMDCHQPTKTSRGSHRPPVQQERRQLNIYIHTCKQQGLGFLRQSRNSISRCDRTETLLWISAGRRGSTSPTRDKCKSLFARMRMSISQIFSKHIRADPPPKVAV